MSSQANTKVITGNNYWLEAYIDPFNKRVRIDDFRGNVEKVIRESELLAENFLAEKLIIKVRQEYFADFLARGFICEAKLDQYFLGSDAYFFSKYYSADRLTNDYWLHEGRTMKEVFKLEKQTNLSRNPGEIVLKKADLSDTVLLANLYSDVFPVYPTPLHDPDYIGKTIKQGTIYFCIEQKGVIVSAASAEVEFIL